MNDTTPTTIIEDVYFEHEPDPVRLRNETAAVFGVRPELVVVETIREPRHLAVTPIIRWLRDEDDMPGDFPSWWYFQPPATALPHLDALLSELTGRLGIAAVTQDPDPFTNDLVLHGPDGSRARLPIVQHADADYAIVLSSGMRSLLDRLHRNAALRAAS